MKSWAFLGVTCAMLVVVSHPALAASPPRNTQVGVASGADCEHLLSQFDVAWNAHSAAKRADAARRARDLGEAACREGRYSDGVHQLKRALHDLGLKPVHRAGGVSSR